MSVRLHTEGRWVKDAFGNIVILKGAALFWRFMYCTNYTNYDPLSYSDEISEASLDTFKAIGANFLRLTVNGYIWSIQQAPNYIAAIDTVISWAKQRDLMVVLDNHGWYNPSTDSNYKTKAQLISEQTEWQTLMVALAQKYTNEPTVIGFDMFNEPNSEGGVDWSTWRPNVLSTIQAIHAVDSSYLCFVEPLLSATSVGDMGNFKNTPLSEPNIVYSAHNYYAWDHPYVSYAANYGAGNFAVAKQQMEQEYYARWINMIEANLPVMNMETGTYRDIPNKNPNWQQWMSDSLELYKKYNLGHGWYPFDPDRTDSSLISLLSSDRITLTNVGATWQNSFLGQAVLHGRITDQNGNPIIGAVAKLKD